MLTLARSIQFNDPKPAPSKEEQKDQDKIEQADDHDTNTVI